MAAHLLRSDLSARPRAGQRRFCSWGAKKGDRIALISENRWEWAVTDFATLAIGAADVPIYPTLTGEQIAVLLRDAGCRIAVVSTRQQFDKLNAVRAQTQLERIVIMDPLPLRRRHCLQQMHRRRRCARHRARSGLRCAGALRGAATTWPR